MIQFGYSCRFRCSYVHGLVRVLAVICLSQFFQSGGGLGRMAVSLRRASAYGSVQLPGATRAGGRKSERAAQPLTSKASRMNISFRVVLMARQIKPTFRGA